MSLLIHIHNVIKQYLYQFYGKLSNVFQLTTKNSVVQFLVCLDNKGTVPVVHSAPAAHSSELFIQLKKELIELGKEKATQYLGYIKCSSLKIGCQYKKNNKYNITQRREN